MVLRNWRVKRAIPTMLQRLSGLYEISLHADIRELKRVARVQSAQVEEFVRDFYITACMGILKWFLFLATIAGPNAVWSQDGTIPIKAISFALERCAEYIRFKKV